MRYPKPWLAAVLGFLLQPVGMLYVGQAGWAAVYFFSILLAGVILVFVGLWDLLGILSWAASIVCAIHAYRLAKRIPENHVRPGYSRWYGMLGILFVVAGITFLLRAFLFEPFHIPAGSMAPNLKVGQYIWVKKWGYGHYGSFGITPFRAPVSAPLERGDVVVFDYPVDPSLQYVKRIIGMPGDVVAIHGNKLSLNGQRVTHTRLESASLGAEQYLEQIGSNTYAVLLTTKPRPVLEPLVSFPFRDQCDYSADEVRCSVPAGHYFMLGDNRDNSQDSRYWGFVPQENIVGKVVRVMP